MEQVFQGSRTVRSNLVATEMMSDANDRVKTLFKVFHS